MRPTTDTRINPGQAYPPAPYPPPWPQRPPAPTTGSWDFPDPATGSWDHPDPATGSWDHPDPATGSWDFPDPATGSWDRAAPQGWGAARPGQPRPAPASQPRPRPPAPPQGPPPAGWPGRPPTARWPAAPPVPKGQRPSAYADPRRAGQRPGSQVPARTRGGVPATRSSSVPERRYDSGRHQRSDGSHARPGGAGEAMAATARTAAASDAQLLTAFTTLVSSVPALYPRVIFLALGYASIGPLAAAYSEVLPLPYGARLILLPAVLISILVGFRHREWGRRALVGWLAGVAATGIYDVLRLVLYKFGYWDDPIPGIGRLMLDNPHAPAIWGYVWRFGGNGAGMGMAFAMLPWRGIRSGIIYGTAICFGLFAVLALAPVAQQHFFPLTVKTAIGALAGHWVYGAVLGYLTSVSLPPVRLSNLPFVPDAATLRRSASGVLRAAPGGHPRDTAPSALVPVQARSGATTGMQPAALDRRAASTRPPAGGQGQGMPLRGPSVRAPRPGAVNGRAPRPGAVNGQAPRRPVPGGAARQAQPRDQGQPQGGRHIRPKDAPRRAARSRSR